MLSGDPESSLRIARAFLNYRAELLEQAGRNINLAKSETRAVHRQVSEKSNIEGAAVKEDKQDRVDES